MKIPGTERADSALLDEKMLLRPRSMASAAAFGREVRVNRAAFVSTSDPSTSLRVDALGYFLPPLSGLFLN